jgi:hypothetical protein
MVYVARQTSEQGRARQRVETWISAAGRVWQRNAQSMNGRQLFDEVTVHTNKGNDFDAPSPAFLRSLPTGVAALQRYLRGHVTGSGSTDEAVFVAIGDMLRWGYAPPALRAAAVNVLARTPHVELGATTRDPLGRPVREFEFVDAARRPGEVSSLLFDTRTAQIVGTSTDAKDLHLRSTIEKADVVDAVPHAIVQAAVPR